MSRALGIVLGMLGDLDLYKPKKVYTMQPVVRVRIYSDLINFLEFHSDLQLWKRNFFGKKCW